MLANLSCKASSAMLDTSQLSGTLFWVSCFEHRTIVLQFECHEAALILKKRVLKS